MGDMVILSERRPQPHRAVPTIQKVINGEVIELVDVDAMTPAQRAAYFEHASAGRMPAERTSAGILEFKRS